MEYKLRNSKMIVPYEKLVRYTYNKLGLGTVVSDILVNRHVSYGDIKNLLSDPWSCLKTDSLALTGCLDVCESILSMINSKKDIVIFADYDVDGLMSGQIMYRYLKDQGASVSVYYPERNEGYGLSVKFVKTLGENNAVITVDNGIMANAAIDYCKKNNIQVVVTDHHEPGNVIPDVPICDPWLGIEGHEFCGAAVALKVCEELDRLMDTDYAKQYYCYAAIGTITDVMPFTLENQAIINIGLQQIKNGLAPNILEFVKALRIPELSSTDIAWKIGPELNACSRMGNTQLAAEFLSGTGTKSDIQKLIQKIDQLNETRKKLTKEALADASEFDYSKDEFCLFDAKDYPAGISGIIANKLMEKYNKPAIVYKSNTGVVWSGSLRSPGIDMLPLLKQEAELGHIISYGGHAQACGINLLPDLESFKESFNKALRSIDYQVSEPVVYIDSEIIHSDVNKKTLSDLSKIPTDNEKFPAPKFIIRDAVISGVRYSKNNPNNVCLSIVDRTGSKRDYWGWGIADKYNKIKSLNVVDIIGTLGWGFGNEQGQATFVIEDFIEPGVI